MTDIFLQVQRRVVHQRLDHAHQIDQQSQIVLCDIDLHLQTHTDVQCTGCAKENRLFFESL